MDDIFDVVVIGGGPGGYVSAIRAAQLGLRTAVAEERELGGTWLNRGCIPTKALLHSAEVYDTVRTCEKYGIFVKEAGFVYSRMASHKDAVVRQLRRGVEALVKSHGIVSINGRAFIRDANTVEITGAENRVLTAGKLIIATGSRPSKPPIEGIDGDKIMDSDRALSLSECPEKIIILGGGVIGVEFATIFSSLGKETVIIEMMDSILPGTDREIASILLKSMERRGVRIFTSSRVKAFKQGPKAICSFERDGRLFEEEGDAVIVAVGRRPNVEGIGLENIGVELEKGFIKVDERLETSHRGVYAVGDVTGKVLLAHAASAQGLVAAANAAGGNQRMDHSAVPACIYTRPEIASVGLTEEMARKNGRKICIGRFPTSANGKSLVMGEKEGLAKIISDERTGEILGTHIIGPRATDMISEASLAMKLESTIEEVANTIHPHPTVSEVIMEAAHDIMGSCVHKPKNELT